MDIGDSVGETRFEDRLATIPEDTEHLPLSQDPNYIAMIHDGLGSLNPRSLAGYRVNPRKGTEEIIQSYMNKQSWLFQLRTNFHLRRLQRKQ